MFGLFNRHTSILASGLLNGAVDQHSKAFGDQKLGRVRRDGAHRKEVEVFLNAHDMFERIIILAFR